MVAAYYFAMRPVTLRIAVGPANSDDLKVVQALTQAFTRHSQIRLRPFRPMAPPRARKRWPTARSISPSSAAISSAEKRPAVATLRKNVAVLWVPPPEGQRQEARPKITKIPQLAGRRVGVVGRTPANVNLLKVILQQYGIDPSKVEIVQFPASEVADAIRSQKADAYLAAGPVNSKIFAEHNEPLLPGQLRGPVRLRDRSCRR